MMDDLHPWAAYARLQEKLASTTCVVSASGMEDALNAILEPDFVPSNLTEADLRRATDSSARKARHRARLVRIFAPLAVDGAEEAEPDEHLNALGPASLDEAMHARFELARIRSLLREQDWLLIVQVATGEPYEELARELDAAAPALRSRVLRLRKVIGVGVGNS